MSPIYQPCRTNSLGPVGFLLYIYNINNQPFVGSTHEAFLTYLKVGHPHVMIRCLGVGIAPVGKLPFAASSFCYFFGNQERHISVDFFCDFWTSFWTYLSEENSWGDKQMDQPLAISAHVGSHSAWICSQTCLGSSLQPRATLW